MAILTFVVVASAVAVSPAAYELDHGVLPAANAVRYYEYTIVLSFKGEPDVKIPTGHGKDTGPVEATDSLMECLGDVRWKLKRDGVRVTIYGYDDVRILNVTVEGKGPKPLVRRLLLPPPEKK